ncbi:MAG: hypothetical protein Q9162_004656 [Coniocarpon cinnabarinum]
MQLEFDRAQAREEIFNLRRQLSKCRSEQADLCTELQRVNEVVVSADMIKDEPNDSELKNAFGGIINEIQTISHQLISRDLQLVSDEGLKPAGRFYIEAQKSCRGQINGLRWRLRAEIFHVLTEELLGLCHFGLQGNFETLLGDFEQRVAEVNPSAAASWRKQTIDCIKKLECPADGRRVIAKANDRLFGYLEPLEHLDNLAKARLSNELNQLCEKAFQLMQQMRNAQSDFEVFQIPRGHQICTTEEKGFKVSGTENETLSERDIPGSKVAYGMAGGLHKIDFRANRSVVLEKALVIFER